MNHKFTKSWLSTASPHTTIWGLVLRFVFSIQAPLCNFLRSADKLFTLLAPDHDAAVSDTGHARKAATTDHSSSRLTPPPRSGLMKTDVIFSPDLRCALFQFRSSCRTTRFHRTGTRSQRNIIAVCRSSSPTRTGADVVILPACTALPPGP
jgi:hypothetical protein